VKPKTALCPGSGAEGKKVGRVTLRALARDEFQDRLADAEYFFCDAVGCDVVYFTPDGRTITKSQLKVEVGVKEAAGDRPLCYCFGHSIASLKEELRTKGRCDALADIRRQMKDSGCACEVMNPSGSCCLGTVGRGIETASAELAGTTPTRNRAEKISKLGTVLSAMMASSCCWLPLLLLAFGVSGAGIAGALDVYRPLFVALTVGCLTTAFYFTYRPRRTATPPEDCCAPAGECGASRSAGRRSWVLTPNTVMLWGVTVLAVAFLFFPNYLNFFLTGSGPGRASPDNPLVRTTSFTVEGMTCEGCAALLGKVIKAVPGVLDARVDYDKKRAVVSTQACCPAPVESILHALEKAGYRGAVAPQDEP
jgi:copper chaperone CopZ